MSFALNKKLNQPLVVGDIVSGAAFYFGKEARVDVTTFTVTEVTAVDYGVSCKGVVQRMPLDYVRCIVEDETLFCTCQAHGDTRAEAAYAVTLVAESICLDRPDEQWRMMRKHIHDIRKRLLATIDEDEGDHG